MTKRLAVAPMTSARQSAAMKASSKPRAPGTASLTQLATQSATQSLSAVSHDAVIRVYGETGDVIETHEQAGGFKEF